MTPEEMLSAEIELRRAEVDHKARTGYGSSTIRGIANSLQHGSLEAARAEWCNDGDKIQAYPELVEAVTKVLGCRLHWQHNCKNWICSGKLPRSMEP